MYYRKIMASKTAYLVVTISPHHLVLDSFLAVVITITRFFVDITCRHHHHSSSSPSVVIAVVIAVVPVASFVDVERLKGQEHDEQERKANDAEDDRNHYVVACRH